MKTQLFGHTSPETAYVVADYPYGFRLRCQIRYWVETKVGFGQRVVSQTSNPKKPGLVWNKPKPGIYWPIAVIYLNEENQHVEVAALSPYSDRLELDEFVAQWPQLDEHQQLVVKARYAAFRIRNGGPTPEGVA